MQETKYDIREVKYYFYSKLIGGTKSQFTSYEEVSLSNIKYGIISSRFSDKSKSDIVAGIYGGLISSIAFIFLGLSIVGVTLELTTFLIGGILVYRGLKIQPDYKYDKLQEYLANKATLEETLKKLEREIQDDRENQGLDIYKIESVKNLISDITTIIKNLNYLNDVILSIKGDLNDVGVIILEDFISLEKLWLMEYISRFQNILKSWLEVHKYELSQYNNTVFKKGKIDFSISSKRLEEHIESLSKVQINL